MKENIEIFGPLLIAAGYCVLMSLIFRACGFTWLRQVTPERVKPWRRLRRWQFVIIYGIGTLTAPLILYSLSYDFLERHWNVYYKPSTANLATWSMVVCVPAGVWFGLSTWKKIWQHEYDLPG